MSMWGCVRIKFVTDKGICEDVPTEEEDIQKRSHNRRVTIKEIGKVNFNL